MPGSNIHPRSSNLVREHQNPRGKSIFGPPKKPSRNPRTTPTVAAIPTLAPETPPPNTPVRHPERAPKPTAVPMSSNVSPASSIGSSSEPSQSPPDFSLFLSRCFFAPAPNFPAMAPLAAATPPMTAPNAQRAAKTWLNLPSGSRRSEHFGGLGQQSHRQSNRFQPEKTG